MNIRNLQSSCAQHIMWTPHNLFVMLWVNDCFQLTIAATTSFDDEQCMTALVHLGDEQVRDRRTGRQACARVIVFLMSAVIILGLASRWISVHWVFCRQSRVVLRAWSRILGKYWHDMAEFNENWIGVTSVLFTRWDCPADGPADNPIVWTPMSGSGVVSGISNMFDFSDTTPDAIPDMTPCEQNTAPSAGLSAGLSGQLCKCHYQSMVSNGNQLWVSILLVFYT